MTAGICYECGATILVRPEIAFGQVGYGRIQTGTIVQDQIHPGGAANIGRRARPQREPKEIGVTRQDVLHATREEVAIAVEEEIGLGPTPVEHDRRSEEHTSELQSLMRISYAVFCLKKKKT